MSQNRRAFLRNSGLGLLPAAFPLADLFAGIKDELPEDASKPVKFYGDGEMFEPADYIVELQKANAVLSVNRDNYGVGGIIDTLEKKFAEITGKERAIYMPTGTMANQLAISVLSGEKTKVFVQDTSHIYRDEADAAQSVFGRRLMPLAKDEAYFTAQELQKAIEELPSQEVFQSGVGAVSIENPVRRSDGRMVPLSEIEKISSYCRSNGIKMHLDGARLFMTSAWSGVPIKKWASYFDTVYISLYKYLGASGGAVLCGDKAVIDKMPHLMKVHGGTVYGNWINGAMALHRLQGFEERLKAAAGRAKEIFAELNKLPGIRVSALDGGTNIYHLQLDKAINGKQMQQKLNKEFNIRVMGLNQQNKGALVVNETLLYQDAQSIINAFRQSIS